MNKSKTLKYSLIIISISIFIYKSSLKNEILSTLKITRNTNYNSYKKAYVKLLRKYHPDKNEDNKKYYYYQNLNDIYFSSSSKYRKHMKNLLYLGKLPFIDKETIEDEVKLEKFKIFFSFVFKILLFHLLILFFIFYSFEKTYKIFFGILFNLFFFLLQIGVMFNQVLFLLKDKSMISEATIFIEVIYHFFYFLEEGTLKEILNLFYLGNLFFIIFFVLIMNIRKKKDILNMVSYRDKFIQIVKINKEIGKLKDKNERIAGIRKLLNECEEIIPIIQKEGFLKRTFKTIIKIGCFLLLVYSVIGK